MKIHDIIAFYFPKHSNIQDTRTSSNYEKVKKREMRKGKHGLCEFLSVT
jgi:hypothetical protein